MVMRLGSRLRHSGPLARQFWAQVNQLPADEQPAVYAMGCMLQDLEERVLRYLRDAERRTKERRK